MSPRFTPCLGPLAFVVCLTPNGGALAAPLPLSQIVRAGRPAKTATLSAEVTPKGLTVGIGSRRHALSLEGATDVKVETVSLEGDGAVNVVRATGPHGQLVALFGGVRGDELLLSERSDFHGDPGERTRLVVEQRTQGAGAPLVIGVRHEAVALCGGHEALFMRRTIQPKTLTLIAADAPAIKAGDMVEVTATAVATRPASVFRALDAVTSSRVDGSGPLTPMSPLSLVDGHLETAWSTTAKGPAARGEFAILRWRGKGFPIERVVLVPPTQGPKLPKSVWLLADAVTLHVAIPEDTQGPVEVALPTPVDARCVALVIEATRKADESAAIAEVQISTAVEREGGLERLVTLLVQDDPRADDIASALGELGPEAATRVAGRFEELSARGKRRALRVLLRHLELEAPRARVLEAARHDPALQDTALAGLRTAGEPGRKGLRELSMDDTGTGDAAATWLSRETGEVSTLLRALASEGGPARPGLREALVGVARRDGAAFDAAAQAWLDTKPRVAARVSLALVLSRTGQHADRAASVSEQVLGELAPTDEGFQDRYRMGLALAGAGPSKACDAWLDEAARKSKEWMIRRVAFAALKARDPARAATLAATLARDPYPRVRSAALASLVSTPERTQVEKSALEDGWPLVRVAAVHALAQSPDARPALRKAVDDTSRRVRSAAIEALTALSDREAWSLVQARLVAPGEWPEVHAAAMHFARALCIQESREPLLFTLRHALRADATDDDVRLGLDALRTLNDLGGQAAADALLVATRDGAPPGLVRVAKELPPSQCTTASASATPAAGP